MQQPKCLLSILFVAEITIFVIFLRLALIQLDYAACCLLTVCAVAFSRSKNRSNSTVVSDGQKIAVLQEKIKALTQENKALTQESLNKDHAIDEHLARIAELEEDNSTKENLINGYRARIAELENAPEFQRPPPTLRGNVENDAHVQASRDRYERTLRDGAEDDDDDDENASLGSDDNDDDGSFASIRRNFDENVALLLRESREDFQSLKQKYFGTSIFFVRVFALPTPSKLADSHGFFRANFRSVYSAGGPPAPPRRDLGGPTEQSGNNSGEQAKRL